MTSPRPRRFAARLAAAAAAGTLAAGAFALPASAQVEGTPQVDFTMAPMIVAGAEPTRGIIEVEYEPSEATDPESVYSIAAELTFEGVNGLLQFDTGEECETSAGVHLFCLVNDADPYTAIEFDYWAPTDAMAEVFDYTLNVSVNGEASELITGRLEIVPSDDPEPHHPFNHSDVDVTDAAPGSTVEVTPTFLQDRPLSSTTAAIVITFSDPFSRAGGEFEKGAEAVADYDNCFDGRSWDDNGVTCVFTDYEDLPGTFLTLSGPIGYAIDQDAPGPLDICNCTYRVETVDASSLESEFGGVFWDESSDNLLSLEVTDSWDGPTEEWFLPYEGIITITTSDNPIDLAVEDLNVEGDSGDEVTVTVPVTNHGPAAAYSRSVSYGSYAVSGQLPAGLELVSVDSAEEEAWSCIAMESLGDEYDYQKDQTKLERFDFSCYFEGLDSGESIDFTFTVEITDAAPAADGLIEVRGHAAGEDANVLDGVLENNLAVIGVNAADLIGNGGDDTDASGKLPTTGGSMTIVISAAAAALVAGAIMFVLVRRRKANADW